MRMKQSKKATDDTALEANVETKRGKLELAPIHDELLAELARIQAQLLPVLRVRNLDGIDVSKTHEELAKLERKTWLAVDNILADWKIVKVGDK